MTLPSEDPDAPVPPPAAPELQAGQRLWTISRHGDVSAVLRSAAFGVTATPERLERIAARSGHDYSDLLTLLRGMFLFQDGDRLARGRAAVRNLLADSAARWPAARQRAAAREIVDALPFGETDAVPTIADPLPTRVLADMLGIPAACCEELRAEALLASRAWLPTAALRDLDRAARAAQAIRDGLRAHDGPDGWRSRLTTGHPDDRPLEMASALIFAGADTVAGAVSAALDLLARNPDWQLRLRRDRALLPGFIREALRLAGPLRRLSGRVARARVEIGGATILPGDIVMLRIDRAHRDPAVYPDPERIDPARKGAALLAFGGGAHICQGTLAGILQTEVIIGAVLDRFTIRPGTTRGSLLAHDVWRVFETLPLQLEAADM